MGRSARRDDGAALDPRGGEGGDAEGRPSVRGSAGFGAAGVGRVSARTCAGGGGRRHGASERFVPMLGSLLEAEARGCRIGRSGASRYRTARLPHRRNPDGMDAVQTERTRGVGAAGRDHEGLLQSNAKETEAWRCCAGHQERSRGPVRCLQDGWISEMILGRLAASPVTRRLPLALTGRTVIGWWVCLIKIVGRIQGDISLITKPSFPS